MTIMAVRQVCQIKDQQCNNKQKQNFINILKLQFVKCEQLELVSVPY